MNHSTKEFVLTSNWFGNLRSACGADRLFRKNDCLEIDEDKIVDLLLRNLSDIPPIETLNHLKLPIPTEPVKLAQYIEKLNLSIGRYFGHRNGFRDSPLLVISQAHPWASFFSPISNARESFKNLLASVFNEARASKLTLDVMTAAIMLIIIVCHPFLDCNGRTTRLLLNAMLKKTLYLSDGAAFYYAKIFSGTNSSFILAVWEIRENNDYSSYIKLLK